EIGDLRKQIDQLQGERADALQKYTESAPQVQGIDVRIQALNGQLAAKESQLQGLEANKPTQILPFARDYVTPKSGSGFCIADDYVVTTADVLEGMQSPLVVTDNGTRVKAKIVGINSDLNVGLLKLLAKADVTALKLGDSSTVEVGHFAISIGNQSGQAN